MIQNNNLSVLPFYDRIERQQHRKFASFGAIYPLFMPLHIILPFQFIIPTTNDAIHSVILYDKCGNACRDVTTKMVEIGLCKKRFTPDGYDIIFYPGIAPIAEDLRKGTYYLKMTIGTKEYFSDMFRFEWSCF